MYIFFLHGYKRKHDHEIDGWFSFFSHFHFPRKTKKKISLKNQQNFSINIAENFNYWLVKISGHGFSSFFAKFNDFFFGKLVHSILENN